MVVGEEPERWAPEQRGPGARSGARSGAAPGQAAELGPSAVGPEADAWALGALLYRALTGGPLPADGPAPAPTGSAPAGERRRPGQRKELGSSTRPPDPLGPLAPLVRGLLAADPRERPQLAEVQRQLRLLLARAPEPVGTGERIGPAALPPGPRRAALTGRRRTAIPARAEHGTERRPEHRSAHRPEQSARPQQHAAHHHAAPHRSASRPYLLGVALVGGVLLIVISGLVIVALTAG
ncbi:hypothetical protein GXW82_37810 [Streptacidiphilus sp. 4-A2]|nr:hypothetical protein [Streptacidiphilus sp. 4-A2]